MSDEFQRDERPGDNPTQPPFDADDAATIPNRGTMPAPTEPAPGPSTAGRPASRSSSSVLPSAIPRVLDSHDLPARRPDSLVSRTQEPPWTLQQFFDGQIDLDVELTRRFPQMPMMSRIKFSNLGDQQDRRSALMSAQDGSATVIIDADLRTKVMQMSFTIRSMITLRFTLDELSDMDRQRWLDLMRRDQGGLSFLWGASRWQNDYLICIGRKYFTNLYAFSPNNFEAGVRVTPQVLEQLMDWLEEVWHSTVSGSGDEDAPLLTW